MSTERYHPLVANDLRDACHHYDAIASFLGERFRINVQLKIRQLLNDLNHSDLLAEGFVRQ